ncbi:MAG: HAD-IIIC family phosphatase [Pygmaiobacter massiliensis]|nr:HAD-IIIC family phosphatase [Pygmaiobacter massiliensis]
MQQLEYPFDSAELLQKKRSLKRELLKQEGLIEKKVAILSGSTIGEIKNILELFLLQNGIKPLFWEGEYGLFYEQLVFDDGSLRDFAPDFVYLHTSRQNLKFWPSVTDTPQQVKDKQDADFARFEEAFLAAAKLGCPVIVNNFDLPPYRVMGSRDAVDARGGVRYVNELNARLADFVQSHANFYLNDICYLSACSGLDNWFSASQWYLYKYALSMESIPKLCFALANIIKSLLGKNKKGLVLDLDNTLWGGVIGDDGPDGIALGAESGEGMAYTAFQSYVKQLAGLGVLLNVASKNEASIAKAGFGRPESVLKPDDFLCFEANWDPKPQSVEKIAKTLNILPESLVFVDDNPAERELMRQQLPQVALAQFSGPEEMIAAIDRAGWFETTVFSADDAHRSEMYKENLQRAQLQATFADYGSYLESLDMVCECGRFTPAHAERITQLINKTNQFNLTTRRYSMAEVNRLMEAERDKKAITLYGRLTDRFGDNGIVSAMIGTIEGDTCRIDLWIMSCRVFKRGLEDTMMDQFVKKAQSLGVQKLKGEYLASAKNLLVADIYGTMGFRKEESSEKGASFVLNLADYQPRGRCMRLEQADGEEQ